MSERRACKAIACCRMTIRYESTRPDDRDLRERMKAIAHERRRFGYRRVHVLLKREGYLVNHKKLFRLYREDWRSAVAAAANGRSAPERR
jgi:putative transposase